MSNPDDSWREIAPADCVGYPAIALCYQRELIQMAADQGKQIDSGQTVTAEYHRVDGKWWPLPETLEIS